MSIRALIWGFVSLMLVGILTLAGGLAIVLPDLPPTSKVRDIRLKEPLRVYTTDGQLMGEFGDERRITIPIEEAPDLLIKAILAAEDDRFFQHHGVDFSGVLRAVIANLKSLDSRQGASTITMQVARNYFLSREKTYSRKIKEVLLAFRLERELTKAEILELYLNKIFLGHRAYGFQAAASIYYNKRLSELSLAQLAMLAGLPKAPSRSNPVSDPGRALDRRNYVLRRMHGLELISDSQYAGARSAPVTAQRHKAKIQVYAPYVSEIVRKHMVERYGDLAYQSGFRVYTTIDPTYQDAANQALTTGLLAYEERHGYRGPQGYIDPDKITSRPEQAKVLAQFDSPAPLRPVLVLRAGGDALDILRANGQSATITVDGWRWTGRTPSQFLNPGDVIYVTGEGASLRLAQAPLIQGALVSLNPTDGAVLALVGGFNFKQSKFNRVTQALRQPGSNIKPFIYSAALENGFTAASLVSGAPVVVEDHMGGAWRPQNYSRKVFGPTRLRKALSLSLNLVSVRLVRAMGIELVRDYLAKFGFDRGRLPRGLALALGSATVTPLEIARGYTAFANGGYLIEPFFIARVENPSGDIVEYANRLMICPDCPTPNGVTHSAGRRVVDPRFARRVLSPENAFIMNSMMSEVIRSGTGRAAQALGRNDLAGKTGTTNNYHDAWFTGYSPDIVTSVWIGFDSPRDLGSRESGARAALPVWLNYMRVALLARPQVTQRRPEKIITLRINRDSGLPTDANDPQGFDEFFITGTEPTADPSPNLRPSTGASSTDPVEGLF
jgi:penicillin-binding protein 1A